jgi:sugar phosphate isomerase/epimerase
MRLGVCTSAIEHGQALEASGVGYLEENVQSFLAPEGPAAEFDARLAAARAGPAIEAACCFLPGDLAVVGPATDAVRLAAWGRSAIARAQAAGIQVIVIGSGGARRIPAGWSLASAERQFADYLRQLGPLAAAAGVTLAVEPLNRGECNFINTISEGAELVRTVGHPQVRLVVDVFHMLRNGETPEEVRAGAGLIAHAHIAERERRSAPGIAGDDLVPYLRELRRAGYDRRLSCECAWGDVRRELPGALATLRAQLAAAGYPA